MSSITLHPGISRGTKQASRNLVKRGLVERQTLKKNNDRCPVQLLKHSCSDHSLQPALPALTKKNCSEVSQGAHTPAISHEHSPTKTKCALPHAKGMNGKEHKAANVRKPGIVVIHQKAFFRDCFARCLQISYNSHNTFAFASVTDWRNSSEPSALSPAIIVFFIDNVGVSLIADLQFLEATAVNTPVVIMSDADDIDHIVRALENGARGYIPTSLSFNIAVEAVRLVEAGGTFVPASSLVHDHCPQAPATKPNGLLTGRQMMVAEALCQGMANKQIAYQLNMSEHTVKVHLRHIMRKLKARNRTEVAVLTMDFFDRPHDGKVIDLNGRAL